VDRASPWGNCLYWGVFLQVSLLGFTLWFMMVSSVIRGSLFYGLWWFALWSVIISSEVCMAAHFQ
jgi:Na+/melibiose symporter-like transporter